MAVDWGQHPTTYDWRPDVRRVVRRIQRRFPVACNTYVDHPVGWHLDDVSVDTWSEAGRGVSISEKNGNRVFAFLMSRDHAPWFRWIIWQGRIYYPNGTDYPYWDASDMHYDHVHVTFW